MNENPMETTRSPDGYFKLKDLMKAWGHKHALSTEDVLSAVGEFMFKRVRGEMGAHFLVYRADSVGADIYLSIPEPGVQ